MVELLRSDPTYVEYNVRKTEGVYAHFGWLRAYFKMRL